MRYKLILSDIDGTLIKDDLSVSEENKAAIAAFRARGGQFVICTGRLIESVRGFIDGLSLNEQKIAAVGLQGAVIKDSAGKLLCCRAMDADTAFRIVRYAEETGTYCHIYDSDRVYIPAHNEINRMYAYFTGAPLCEKGVLSAYIRQNRFAPIKVMLVIERGSEDRYFKAFGEMGLVGVKNIMSSDTYFEFVSDKAGKGEGLLAAAAYLGIDPAETIAIGDNMNDIEMIETAGLGVAVKNAIPALKNAADLVTERDNNESAVAEVIRRFCLD
ncbi:MAG: Cof-type HAD-IIB family hydrolase [Clostridiales bacterium]|jgi:Cof subfamily protein (haloacid dehalogenase superfamily)|nr:Cof-type HAD-IIB family hydrolase [Clostridiales bacterium]